VSAGREGPNTSSPGACVTSDAPVGTAASAASRILIVDDEPEIVALLREFLESRGCAVATAASVATARAALHDRSFELVLLDLRLPDGSGIDVLREAQTLTACPEIVMVTAHASLDSAIAAMEAGAAGYVLKPLDLEQLGVVVERVLERRKLVAVNASLQTELTRRLRESEALLTIARTLGETLDVREALRRICRELARLTGADTSAAYLYDPDGDLLQPYAAYRVPPEHLQLLAGTGLPVRAEGFYLPVWEARQPIYSDSIATDPRFHHTLFRSIPHQSGLILPLVLDDEVAGAFYLVWWTTRRTFDAHELTLVQDVAQQVGLLLRNVRLFDAGERTRRRLEILYEVSRRLAAVHATNDILSLIVNEAVRLLGVDAAGLRLREGDDLVVGARTESAALLMSRERLRMGESLSGVVAATGEPVIVEDLASDARYDDHHKRGALALGYHGFAGVPLRASGGVIGVLNVYSRSGRRFRPDELSLLSALADQASLAIEKSRLLQATQAREREFTKLYTITSQLASNLSLDRVLDLITSDVIDLLRCDAAGVYGYDPDRDGLTFRRGLNLDPELTRNLVLRPGEGVAGRAFAERQPIWTKDRLAAGLQYSHEAARLIAERAPRAYLAVPILRRDAVYGVLVGYWFAPHECSPDEIRLLSTLAAQAAIAVDNSVLFEETRTQQMRLSQIFDSTSDGIMLVDHAGLIAAANKRVAWLLGLDAPPIDRPLAGLLDGLQVRDTEDWRRLQDHPPTPDSDGRQGDIEVMSPAPRVLRWSAEPTRDAAGVRVGVTLTLQDVTREREVNQMKSDFVSFVTHQLRTPLAGIKWLLELAAEDPALPEDARGYIADSREAARRLIALVNDLLDISRLESGRLTIAPVPVDLVTLTQDVLRETEGLMTSKGHEVVLTGAGTAIADTQLLRQVVLNLVSNAAKYTPAGGKIEIRIDGDRRDVTWSVSDNGIGIPASARPRLFEKFYRADNVQALETEGTGLGLYLVRLIVEQLRGRIRYESAEAQGSTFVVTIPAAEPATLA
jgi:signal transduction histidine kinase/DNA-binding response OmpR family regulator/putative methionine-R-sulfoxide reductase with GAF domain